MALSKPVPISIQRRHRSPPRATSRSPFAKVLSWPDLMPSLTSRERCPLPVSAPPRPLHLDRLIATCRPASWRIDRSTHLDVSALLVVTLPRQLQAEVARSTPRPQVTVAILQRRCQRRAPALRIAAACAELVNSLQARAGNRWPSSRTVRSGAHDGYTKPNDGRDQHGDV